MKSPGRLKILGTQKPHEKHTFCSVNGPGILPYAHNKRVD